MDRSLAVRRYEAGEKPNWKCPACGRGVLVSEDKDNIFETTRSKEARSDPDWEPHWGDSIYTCVLRCSVPSCKEIVVELGTVCYDLIDDIDHKGRHIMIIITHCLPSYFEPALKLFDCPNGAPESVLNEMQKSFAVYFVSPSAACTHVRIAIEHLLTSLKVKRYEVRKRKRITLNLHNRISHIPAKYSSVKDHILAIKWLGNAGSHSMSNVSSEDVLDAYDIMKDVLRELFIPRDKRISKIVRKINRKKGPK